MARKKKTKHKPFLSEGIIINILSRVPAKYVMRCRLVCRRWRDLTSDRHFIDLNLRNSPPTILVANPTDHSGLDLFALDKRPERTRFIIHRFPFYSGKFSNDFRLLFSHDGIVVFGVNLITPLEPKYVILNPVWPECVTISFPKIFTLSKIYGVYFHPSLKEYCSLWKMHESEPFYGVYFHPSLKEYCFLWKMHESEPFYGRTLRIQYKILNLSSTPSVKTISNPFSNRIDKDNEKTLLINNYLYWLLIPQQICSLEDFIGSKYTGRNDIMEFDIMREEYMVIPCPVPLNTECTGCQTVLLNIDGILSFLLTLTSEIIIWRLEDHASKLWTTAKYTFSIDNCPSLARHNRIWELTSPIAVVDGKLALQSEGTLFVCNLMEGTMKKYPRNKYSSSARFFSHQISLASLKNCKSTISIDKDGEVVE